MGGQSWLFTGQPPPPPPPAQPALSLVEAGQEDKQERHLYRGSRRPRTWVIGEKEGVVGA